MELNMEKKASNSPWRFERKYQLSPYEYLQFEKLMMLSDIKKLHPDRQINNCYLDSINNNSYTESIEGYSEKMKVRIRWYGELFATTKPVLEFKLKQNNSNKKETFKLFKTTINQSFNWVDYAQKVEEYLSKNFDSIIINRSKPVLINTYKRSYFSNFEKTFRLTIDRELKFLSPNNKLDYNHPKKIDSYIIELKFSNEDLISSFPVFKNLGKFSKFTTGLKLIQ